jgi:hypothetical protein
MIIVIRYSNIFWKRKQIYDKYGFVMERKEWPIRANPFFFFFAWITSIIMKGV